MSDLERRLAAALHETLDGALPPPRLTEMITHRHRRYRRRRMAAGAAATAVAVLLPVTIPALTSATPPPVRAGHGTSVPRRAVAQKGTILLACGDQISSGGYGPNWQAAAIGAGPLWFVDVRPSVYASTDGSSPLPFGTLPVNMRDGTYAWVRVVGQSRRYFRFLFGGANGGSYTLRDGQQGVTFSACQRGQSLGFSPVWTQFWGGFVVSRVPLCVSLDVWTSASRRPTPVTLTVGRADCRGR